jgi:putative transposase
VFAIVLLPDHLHTIWLMPTDDAKYSLRWSAIKGHFSRNWLALTGDESPITPAQEREGRRGVWQPRFYEHLIRDETDLISHADYLHYNPVKHGLADRPVDWPWSSFRRFVAEGHYPPGWGDRLRQTVPTFPGIVPELVE